MSWTLARSLLNLGMVGVRARCLPLKRLSCVEMLQHDYVSRRFSVGLATYPALWLEKGLENRSTLILNPSVSLEATRFLLMMTPDVNV